MSVLITGGAGFIGFHLTKALLAKGQSVVGLDNLNDYYEPQLKRDRLTNIEEFTEETQTKDQYRFIEMDLADRDGMTELFKGNDFDVVVNLGAQAGVRYSIENPLAIPEGL